MASTLLLSGCETQPKTNTAKPAVAKEEYVTMDAPVGSHMKRRVKKSDAKKAEPGMAPTHGSVIVHDTDTTMPAVIGGEMEKAQAARPGGGLP